MNFMGGGRRAMKCLEKDSDLEKEKVINYIQKKMDEKSRLEANGRSIFKANDQKVVNKSQDVIKAQAIEKIYSKPANKSIVFRQVMMERSLINYYYKRSSHRHDLFKNLRKSKNWDGLVCKKLIIGRDQCKKSEIINNDNFNKDQQELDLNNQQQEERLKWTHEWLSKSASQSSSLSYARTYC